MGELKPTSAYEALSAIRARLQNSVNWMMEGRNTGLCPGVADFRELIALIDTHLALGKSAMGDDGKPAVRMLTGEELAACCGGCRTNSAIETWMQRAITKFCKVNGIASPSPSNERGGK